MLVPAPRHPGSFRATLASRNVKTRPAVERVSAMRDLLGFCNVHEVPVMASHNLARIAGSRIDELVPSGISCRVDL